MNERFPYLDNIKVLLICGVITMHVTITYGLDASWYLESYDEMSEAVITALTIALGAGWFFGIGLFFMIAGRLSAPSLERKGPAAFARDRLARLGIPLVAYTLLVAPVLEWVAYRFNDGGRDSFWEYITSQTGDPAPGPTWFLEALLVFSLAYALVRWFTPARPAPPASELSGRQVAATALGIAVTSFAAHWAFPYGSEQMHLQLGMFPQYIIMFSFGAMAARRGWLETLAPQLQKRCGLVGIAAVPALAALFFAGGFFEGDDSRILFAGGLHWQAVGTSLLEGVIAICVSLWAVGYFRRRHNTLRPLVRVMSPAAYGAFLVHPPVIVLLALAVQPVGIPAELKFLFVLTAGIAASFALTVLILRAVGSALHSGAVAGHAVGAASTPRRSL